MCKEKRTDNVLEYPSQIRLMPHPERRLELNPYARAAAPLALMVLAGLVLAGRPKKTELSEEGRKVEFIENVEVIKDKLENPEQCKLVASLRITAMGSTSSVTTKSRLKDEAKDRMIRARNAAISSGVSGHCRSRSSTTRTSPSP